MIAHANKMRYAAEGKGQEEDAIEVTEEWWDRLHALPFISGKLIAAANPW